MITPVITLLTSGDPFQEKKDHAQTKQNDAQDKSE